MSTAIKKALFTVTIILTAAYTEKLVAADKTALNGMADKAAHGFVNFGYGWMEFPMQIVKGYDRGIYLRKDSPAIAKTAGFFWGAGRGVTFLIGRMYLGAYQLVGFWSANPDDNYGIGIPFDGEYPLDEGLLHDVPLKSIHRPMIRKLKRGLSHFGRAAVLLSQNFPVLSDIDFEIPIHIPFTLQYYDIPVRLPYSRSEQLLDPNPLQTLWFIPSRMAVGVYETLGFLLPSSVETEGYSFDL